MVRRSPNKCWLELSLFVEEYYSHDIEANEDSTPPPHPAPTLAVCDVATGYRSQEGARRCENEIPTVHRSMLVNEEDIGNGDLCKKVMSTRP